MHPAQQGPVVDGAFLTTLPHFFGIYGFAGGYRSGLGEEQCILLLECSREPRGSVLSLKIQRGQTLIKHSSGIQGGQTLINPIPCAISSCLLANQSMECQEPLELFPCVICSQEVTKGAQLSLVPQLCPSPGCPFLPQPAECREKRNKCNTKQRIGELENQGMVWVQTASQSLGRHGSACSRPQREISGSDGFCLVSIQGFEIIQGESLSQMPGQTVRN